ncbi:Uncharacterized conserved protein, DUF924 family [Devosia crocina]|uniref:Uncharacterized conserved protein, DUF924 family n=1 Tax=Devosia crocina TaxID=429728 RepID=A0A1I7NUK0_9HYPH|nr:DUF924 family protein [Devosia crocina]SFV38300.1 Uncharacterized conserved protein, DUF924 family [Devosia crocina]
MRTAQDVLDFWFEDHGPGDWFAGKADFDALIAQRFTQTHSHVAKGEAWEWRTTPSGRLAEIIVLDQFSRQLFRKKPEAFAQDKMALVLAQEMVSQGLDRQFEQPRRGFIYLPFMHSESVAIQSASVRLYEALGDDDQLEYAIEHKKCIDRFGRFPFRNLALGRDNSIEELDYMHDHVERGF